MSTKKSEKFFNQLKTQNNNMLSIIVSLAKFIWNPKTRQFFGRTGSSWLKILTFYICFYCCLAGFWLLMLYVFYQTVDPLVPKRQYWDSPIGWTPGLGFRPRDQNGVSDSIEIRFKPEGLEMDDNNNNNNNKDWKYWSDSLADFLEPYEKAATGAHNDFDDQCSDGGGGGGKPVSTDTDQRYCLFDIKTIDANCSRDRDFGYKTGDPCVLIKLNRIYNWMPEPYTNDDLEDDNNNQLVIPDEIRSKILVTTTNTNNNNNNNQTIKPMIYITCNGKSIDDRANIGPIHYYPHQGMEIKYYPFTNQPGYLSPFVFVHFPEPATGVRIGVECKAWARNIQQNRADREGYIQFELFID